MHPLQVFSVKSSSPSSSSSLSSMKLKSLIKTLIVSHMCRIIRALSKVKTVIIETLMDNKRNSKKIIMKGSFRLHYNWSSSKSFRVSHLYYDSKWNPTTTNVIVAEQEAGGEDFPDSKLAGYLQWLEEGVYDGKDFVNKMDHGINEIDMQAEMFIANCHEKFKLEKQESDRKFQEMLARSL
ncbi:hypothetical protein RIF29_26468 [Crotalaria pallida]|uniref:Uncharacterized protein n=1 Tax=Crotalaria pallida TaxID=3830 RepID=A0AAN9ENQ4_CROPI